MLNLLWHEIRSRRNAIIGWGIGLIFYAMMYITIYPEMEEQMAGIADLSIYQAMGVQVGTFEGYLGSTLIGFLPILLGVYAILTSTTTLAGEEDDGTLELLLTTQLSRWQIVTAKALGLLVVTAVIVAIAGLGQVAAFMIIEEQISTAITRSDVFIVVLSSLPIIWALLMLGLFFGAFMPNRRTAMLFGFLILIVSYFGENIGGMVDSLAFIKPFSLFSYFDTTATVFSDGIAAGDVAVLLIVSLIAFGLAIISFNRRDVTVGLWPWQRARAGA